MSVTRKTIRGTIFTYALTFGCVLQSDKRQQRQWSEKTKSARNHGDTVLQYMLVRLLA